jgi:hypothetical protein
VTHNVKNVQLTPETVTNVQESEKTHQNVNAQAHTILMLTTHVKLVIILAKNVPDHQTMNVLLVIATIIEQWPQDLAHVTQDTLIMDPLNVNHVIPLIVLLVKEIPWTVLNAKNPEKMLHTVLAPLDNTKPKTVIVLHAHTNVPNVQELMMDVQLALETDLTHHHVLAQPIITKMD